MKQSQILIRYGEIGLKSENTRRQFTQQLKKNILQACSQEGLNVDITVKRGRFFLHTKDIKKASSILKKIFGIVSFSPVWVSSSDLALLTDDVLTLMESKLTKELSFALRVRRSGQHGYTSQDVAVQIGQSIVDHFKSMVDLEQPDVELFIEIRNEKAYLFFKKIGGVGGLPYGTQGKICCLVKNPADILASWFLMKRGCSMNYFTSDELLQDELDKFCENWYIKKQIKMINNDLQNRRLSLKNLIEKCNCQAICSGLICARNKGTVIEEIKKYQNQFSLSILTPLLSFSEHQYQTRAEQVGIHI